LPEATKLKCGLCDQTFDTEAEQREHERTEHCAEVRPKSQLRRRWNEEETAA